MVQKTEEKIIYTTCSESGCGMPECACPLKVHVKDGILTSIEPGDTLNYGQSMEGLNEEALKTEMFQQRPCSRAYTWRKTIYHPDRAKYPMQRIGKRGKGEFIRISWDKAIEVIVNKIKKISKEHGSHFFLGELPVLQWAGPWSLITWGLSSNSGFLLPDLVTLGHCQGHTAVKDQENHDYADIFNTKLIIWFGVNPAVTQQGSANWVMHAKEKGIPIIIIDPVYSISAEVYADQWIPIRPNTDLAMMLAIANVLFKENLYDKNYVSKYIEPKGFKRWRDYVLGNEAGPDGLIDRSPEWAEKICGVPAKTIQQLARLYAKSKPCYFRLHRSTTRQLFGENAGRVVIYLQAMTGNIGVSGGHSGSDIEYGGYRSISLPVIKWNRIKPPFHSERLLWKRAWMDSILLRNKLKKREISEDYYRRTCGIAQDWPLPNIRAIWLSNQAAYNNHQSGRPSLGNQNLNKVIKAIKELDLIVSTTFFTKSFSNLFADIILPLADSFFEEPQGFLNKGGSASNYFICGFKVVQPPGEARPLEWIMVKIAQKLGVAESYSPRLIDVVDDYPTGWDQRMEYLLKEAYEQWAEKYSLKSNKPPIWEEFKKKPIYRIPKNGPLKVAFRDNIKNCKPFDTPSGKIEFYSDFLADKEMARKSYILPKRKIDNKCCFGGSIPPTIPPMGKWMLPWNSMLGPRAAKYPLAMLTSHSLHRQHNSQDNNPWHRNELRHSIHLSHVDALARGIKDGNLVHVYNDHGEIIIPAYVTSRITPGVVVIPHGAWPELSRVKTKLMPEGIDKRGNDNFLTSSNYYPWTVGVVRCTELVQVEKWRTILQ